MRLFCAIRTREKPAGDALEQAAEPLSDSDPASDREEEALVYRRAMELMQAEFEERTWRAFWQVVVDGRPAGEAAHDLGMSPNAVYLARSRVLRRLREEFADLMDL